MCELRGRTSSEYSAAWSPDGQWLATAAQDNTAAVWDASTGEPLRELRGHTDWVMSVAWSPDGRRLATASLNKTAAVWDALIGKRLRELRGHTAFAKAVAWSPDGRQLATTSDDKTAAVWDASSGGRRLVLKGHASRVRSVAWSRDGRLATLSDDGSAAVWDVGDAKRELEDVFQCPGCSPGNMEQVHHTDRSFSDEETTKLSCWLRDIDAECMGVDLKWLTSHFQSESAERILDAIRLAGFVLFSDVGDQSIYLSSAFLASHDAATERPASNVEVSNGSSQQMSGLSQTSIDSGIYTLDSPKLPNCASALVDPKGGNRPSDLSADAGCFVCDLEEATQPTPQAVAGTTLPTHPVAAGTTVPTHPAAEATINVDDWTGKVLLQDAILRNHRLEYECVGRCSDGD
eukprot:jgi/Chlat1/2798/Chrsp187S00199